MHIGQRYWRRQGLGTKLAITNFVWVAAILAALLGQELLRCDLSTMCRQADEAAIGRAGGDDGHARGEHAQRGAEFVRREIGRLRLGGKGHGVRGWRAGRAILADRLCRRCQTGCRRSVGKCYWLPPPITRAQTPNKSQP